MSSLWSDVRYFEETVNVGKLKALLDGKNHTGASGITERTRAMKWLLAMMSKGRDMSSFYPDVVKNVIAKSVELKKLVYMFLLHYTDHDDQCRELALLSINTFQKDMADANPLIRALALRTMTSIRVKDIVQIQLLAVEKCAKDNSPYVRKVTAHALCKIYSLEEDQKDALIALIIKLLEDRSHVVISSAVNAFIEICPEKLHLIHSSFRRLCQLLVDLDEWGQISLLNIISRYCRKFFIDPRPTGPSIDSEAEEAFIGTPMLTDGLQLTRRQGLNLPSTRALPTSQDLQHFYAEGESDEKIVKIKVNVANGNKQNLVNSPKRAEQMDPDHNFLLKSAIPLLHSRNSGVVIAVCSLLWHCGKRSSGALKNMTAALVRLARQHREVQYCALKSIKVIANLYPEYVRHYIYDFLVNTSADPFLVQLLKLDIMTQIADNQNIDLILEEFETYVAHPNKRFATATIQAIARIATHVQGIADRCLYGLLSLTTSSSSEVVAEAIVVIRLLLQHHPGHCGIVRRIVRQLSHITIPKARASVIWIATEFIEPFRLYCAEVLRKLVVDFTKETFEVKIQIVNFAIRVALKQEECLTSDMSIFSIHEQNAIRKSQGLISDMLRYLLELAHFDANLDLRDRVRFLAAVIDPSSPCVSLRDQILLQYKPPPQSTCALDGTAHYSLDSLSYIVGYTVPGYQPLPPWPTEKPDTTLRSHVELNGKENKNSLERITSDNMIAVEFYSSTGSSSSSKDDSSVSGSSSYDSGDEDSTTSSVEQVEMLSRQKSVASPNLIPKHKDDDILMLFDPTFSQARSNEGMQPIDSFVRHPLEPTSPKEHVLLSSISGAGLCISYSFSRRIIFSDQDKTEIMFRFHNTRETTLSDIRLFFEEGSFANDLAFETISVLSPSQAIVRSVHVDCRDTCSKKLGLVVQTDKGRFSVHLPVPLGELLIPPTQPFSTSAFDEKRSHLRGMHEAKKPLPSFLRNPSYDMRTIVKSCVLESANVAFIPDREPWPMRFVGNFKRNVSAYILVYISEEEVFVNSDNFMASGMFLERSN